jgi:alpha-beta hydrolase superfamily lysophospholipase
MYDAGYNIYTFDLPNHGVNFDYPTQLTFEDYCVFVKDFMKKNKLKKIIIAGHSMGGGIVAALQNDDTLKFKDIILIDPLQKGASNDKVKRMFASVLANGFGKLTE